MDRAGDAEQVVAFARGTDLGVSGEHLFEQRCAAAGHPEDEDHARAVGVAHRKAGGSFGRPGRDHRVGPLCVPDVVPEQVADVLGELGRSIASSYRPTASRSLAARAAMEPRR